MTIPSKRFPPVHIHPIMWAFAAISILTGTFMELTIIFSIVLIHELGHYSVASMYHWRIRKIILWVFGGVMDTDEHGGRPIKEELLVTLAGPAQHLWIFVFLFIAEAWGLVPASIIDLALQYNITIFFFNLLPILPLDGGKALLLLLSLFSSYRSVYNFMILFSMMLTVSGVLIIMIYFPFTLSSVLLASFLFWENRLEWKQRYFVFLRFLLNRYRNRANPKKIYPIVVSPNMTVMQICSLFRLGQRHHIYVKDPFQRREWMDEEACLYTYFTLKQHSATAKEILQSKT